MTIVAWYESLFQGPPFDVIDGLVSSALFNVLVFYMTDIRFNLLDITEVL